MKRRTRLGVLVALLVFCSLTFTLQAVMADSETRLTRQTAESYAGDTLVTVQNYGGFGTETGKARIISEEGNITWEFDPPHSRVFDGEMLENGHVLLSVATNHDQTDCPESKLPNNRGDCVENRVLEVDPATNEIVWEYSWYDVFIDHHEVHDADRLPSGETAIADMGNHRAFTVAKNGTITWEWKAKEHIGPGTEFYERYGGPKSKGPESDWTHLNDIDLLENGNFQLSVRNFDVVLEVRRPSGEIVSVLGQPREQNRSEALLYRQHNPNRIAGKTTLIADSENDRIIETTTQGEIVWEYGGSGILQWPRDADRLPNGNTLITDSLNSRVIEVDSSGQIVWEYKVSNNGNSGLPYEADRLGLPEEPDDVPTGRQLTGKTQESGTLISQIQRYEAWALAYLPSWAGRAELVTLLVGGLCLVLVVTDLTLAGVRRGIEHARG